MTVRDLLDLLSKYPPTMAVMVDVAETHLPITDTYVGDVLSGKSKGEKYLLLSTLPD